MFRRSGAPGAGGPNRRASPGQGHRDASILRAGVEAAPTTLLFVAGSLAAASNHLRGSAAGLTRLAAPRATALFALARAGTKNGKLGFRNQNPCRLFCPERSRHKKA